MRWGSFFLSFFFQERKKKFLKKKKRFNSILVIFIKISFCENLNIRSFALIFFLCIVRPHCAKLQLKNYCESPSFTARFFFPSFFFFFFTFSWLLVFLCSLAPTSGIRLKFDMNVANGPHQIMSNGMKNFIHTTSKVS